LAMNAHERKLRGLLPLDGPAPRVHHVHRGFSRGTNTGYANTIAPFSSRPTPLPRVAAAHHREVAATTTAGGLPSSRPTQSREHATDAWYDGGPAGGSPRAPLPPRWTSCRNLARIAFPCINYTSALATTTSICGRIPSLLPIKDFVDAVHDPYLPQNRRRCHKGTHHHEEMGQR